MQIDGPANIPAEDDGPPIDLDALHAEVAKWQERVPKLAKALRERTEELAAVREELRTAQSQKDTSDSGQSIDARLQAREGLIAELQDKVSQLGEKHRQLSGTLHTTSLDLESAQEEAQGWQAKWQEVTASLDNSVEVASRSNTELEQARLGWLKEKDAAVQSHAQGMQQLQRETESLRVRNANLGETVEFANKQIESLGDDMRLLMDRGKTAEATIAQGKAAQQQLQVQIEEAQQHSATLQAQLSDRQGALDSAQQELQQAREALVQAQTAIADLQQKATSQHDAIDQIRSEGAEQLQQQLQEQADQFTAQIQELQTALETEESRYSSAMQAAEQEQTQLVAQLDGKDTQLADLNSQITEGLQLAQRQLQKIGELEKTQAQRDLEIEQGLSQFQSAADEARQLQEYMQVLQTDLQTVKAQLQAEQAIASEHAEQREKDVAELAKLREEHQRWAEAEQDLLGQVNAVTQAGNEKQLELDAEIARLSECVNQAQDSQTERDEERRQLASRVQLLEETNEKLKVSLDERSALVRELESERGERNHNHQNLEAAQAQAQQQHAELQHKLTTFQEHAQSLEEKLLTQQGLMSELESELSEASSEHNAALKAVEQQYRQAKDERTKFAEQVTALQHRADDLEQLNKSAAKESSLSNQETLAELERERKARLDQQNAVYNLQAEIEQLQATASAAPAVKSESKTGSGENSRELEQLLRERTEELDKLRWKLEQPVENDDKLVMILNQQLDDARQENKRLRDKATAARASEDLTQVKGVGEKLAAQLQDLGISSLAQVADIDIKDLDDESHALHSFKSRIVRDEWVDQAKAILKNK